MFGMPGITLTPPPERQKKWMDEIADLNILTDQTNLIYWKVVRGCFNGLKKMYGSLIESVLVLKSSDWYGHLIIVNRNKPTWIVKTAEKIAGHQ